MSILSITVIYYCNIITIQIGSPFPPRDLSGGLLRLCSRLLGRGDRHGGGQRQQCRGAFFGPDRVVNQSGAPAR